MIREETAMTVKQILEYDFVNDKTKVAIYKYDKENLAIRYWYNDISELAHAEVTRFIWSGDNNRVNIFIFEEKA